jgi:hypothetical protein
MQLFQENGCFRGFVVPDDGAIKINPPGRFLRRALFPGWDAIHQAFVEVRLAAEKAFLRFGLY